MRTLQAQEQIRGPAPPQDLIVLDGKEPKQGGGHSVLTAVTVPSQHYLGSAIVDQKTNEIPVARELFKKLDLDGRRVSLDALHTQDQTGAQLVLEHGADYLLTVKDNQPTLRQNMASYELQLLSATNRISGNCYSLTAPPQLTTITVAPLTLALTDGNTQRLTATTLDQNHQPIAALPLIFSVDNEMKFAERAVLGTGANREIGIFDRRERIIHRVALQSINFPERERPVFELMDEAGKLQRIPFHRAREVWKDGHIIWQRPR
jgi:hypothetical protein